jgi:acyl-CoA hydrolase
MHFDKADRLADAIIERVGRDIVLALPLGLGKANHIANALYARASADPSLHLTIFTALTLEKPRPRQELERRFIEPISRRLFDGYPDLAYAAPLRQGRLPKNIEVNEFFFAAGQWLGTPQAQQSYVSANYTHAMRYILARGVNVVGQLVARRNDRYSLSCNTDLTLDFLAAREQGAANFILAGQVNSELPFMPGAADLPASAFAFVLDSAESDFPLFAPPRAPIDFTDYACGLHAATTVADGGTLQLGIGSLGDAVAQGLVLRHTRTSEFQGIMAGLTRDQPLGAVGGTAPFSAGVYGCSEMFVEAMLDLFHAGILKREVDGALLHAAFFIGSRGFYRSLREMPAAELEKFQMRSVSYVNELYGDEVAKRRARIKGRFINSTMMATVLGELISDTLDDGKVVSGVGGQYNFVAQSFALGDARSIVALRSTRTKDGKTHSNIRWDAGHATIPRHLRDIVVTEYGIADLLGKSDRDVVAAMLAVTDSRYQPELLRQAKEAGKIGKDFELTAVHRENTPERIERALKPAREQGLLPAFPFGTDFSKTEQRLAEALRRLSISSSVQLLRLMLTGMRAAAPTAEVADCLARMGLDRPSTLAERCYRTLLRGTLGGALV